MKGTRCIEDPQRNLRVSVSKPAQRVLDSPGTSHFVEILMAFMHAAGFQWAYVGKSGSTITVSLGHFIGGH